VGSEINLGVRRHQVLLDDLLDMAPVMALVSDRNDVVMAASRRLGDRLGTSPTCLIGQPALSLLVPEDRALLDSRAAVDGLAVRLRCADDALAAVSLSIGRRTGESPVACWVFSEDVETLRRQLHDVSRRAEDAMATRSRFLTAMSHDIRTPMNAVLGLSHLLQRAPLGPEERRNVDAIATAGRSLMETLSSLLALAEPDGPARPPQAAPFSICALLEELRRDWRATALQRGLDLEIGIDAVATDQVIGDRDHLRRVLRSLLDNAFKFTRQGGVAVRCVQTTAEDGRTRIAFSVSDTGLGITDAEIAAVMRPVDDNAAGVVKRAGGLGLGLLVCRRLVASMGGAMTVARREGGGTIVQVVAPVDPAPSRAVVAEAAPASLSVLVAEDNAINGEVLRQMLLRLGHEVDVVTDGFEAVGALDRKRYDLVLMDIRMPRLDGIGATEQIRTRWGEQWRVPIVAVTGQAAPDTYRRCIARGMDDCLTKPVSLASLQQSLDRLRPPKSAAGLA